MAQDEIERLAGLRSYRILDTPREAPFDDADELARILCDAPMALVSLVDAHRQWFKAASGVAIDETPRDTSVCSLAIQGSGLFVIPDLSVDARTAAMSLVAGEGGLRFYAGAPLVTSGGIALGSLCVLDTVPRAAGLTSAQRAGLALLGRQVTTLIEARMTAFGEAEARDAVVAAESHYRHVIDSALDTAIIGIGADGAVTAWSRGAESVFGWSEAEMIGTPLASSPTTSAGTKRCTAPMVMTVRRSNPTARGGSIRSTPRIANASAMASTP